MRKTEFNRFIHSFSKYLLNICSVFNARCKGSPIKELIMERTEYIGWRWMLLVEGYTREGRWEHSFLQGGHGKSLNHMTFERKLEWHGAGNADNCMCAKLLQSRPARCNPVDYSPPGSSVHGILQARILEGAALPSSRGSSWSRNQTHVSYV